MSIDLDAFRSQLRDFIRDNAPDLPFRTGTRSPEDAHEAKLLREWSALLYKHNYYGAEWPEEFGGKGEVDASEGIIVSEELARARAAVPIGAGGLAGFAILSFGNDVQRQFHLPNIRSYEHVWCQLFSEPDAGSDLASMRTKAEPDGDEFVVTGQKVWSTNAKWAEWGFLLARTDPTVSKHAGITAFALDMTLPGIDVRPMKEMTGTSDFNEVFFNEVRVPASAAIGQVNDGWRVATLSLAEERAGVGALVVRLRQGLDALIDLAGRVDIGGRPAAKDPIVRQQLAAFHCRVEIASLLAQATVDRRLAGIVRVQDAPISKLLFANLNWDMGDYGVMLQGMSGTLFNTDPHAVDGGRWQDELLYAKAYTISGGSNEIMRNILSERGLGLPRD
ncbi:MAG: acyl-CoA dehydrogenase family protein [Acidimicrobiia bacterium]